MISQAGSRFQTDKVFVGVLTIVRAGDALLEIVQRIERGSSLAPSRSSGPA
jgi:ABC-type nitrate/sulfonate/bicarbonate transport system permease component